MSVISLLADYDSEILLDTDPGWRQFIADHKVYLKLISPIHQPTAELMGQVGQDLTWYLRYLGINRPIAWIIGYINDIDSDMDFNQSMQLYIPDLTQLEILYQSYITTKQTTS